MKYALKYRPRDIVINISVA